MNATRLIFLIILPLVVIACSKDESNNEKIQGDMTIGDSTYYLSNGSMAYLHEDPDGVFWHWVILHSSGIWYENNTGYMGNGELISFILLSPNKQISESERFAITNNWDIGSPGFAVYVESYLGFEPDSDEVENFYIMKAGTISYTPGGEENKFTLTSIGNEVNFNTEEIIGNDIAINVYYLGSLEDQ